MKKNLLLKVFISILLIGSSMFTNVYASSNPALGATVVRDDNSPSGYTVHFVYKTTEEVDKVEVTGAFSYINPELDLKDPENNYGPYDYKNGYYPANYIPSTGKGGYTVEMNYNESKDCYEVSFPITSGSFGYSYNIYTDGNEKPTVIADPNNPRLDNPFSNSKTSNANQSVVIGLYDDEKQSKSPNLSYVEPIKDSSQKGTFEYIEYTGIIDKEGTVGDTQDMGLYLPANFDVNREKPYKLILALHGSGGNETDWITHGQAVNIMDHVNAQRKDDIVLVTSEYSGHYGSNRNPNFTAVQNNITEYLLPYLEENYNVSADPQDRAICGLSLGAMNTNVFFFDNPTAFEYYGLFSGAYTSKEKFTEGQKDVQIMMLAGTCDVGSTTIQQDPGMGIKYECFRDWLIENEFTNYTDYGLVPGAHDWFTWAQGLYTFANEFVFPEEVIDVTPLEELLTTATQIDQTKITKESANALNHAIEVAKALLQKEDITLEEVEDAKQLLTEALNVEYVQDNNDSTTTTPVPTGDHMMILPSMSICLISAIAIITLRKKEYN